VYFSEELVLVLKAGSKLTNCPCHLPDQINRVLSNEDLGPSKFESR
jgi:hypothetical protein